jgi:ring-1,2-phenylacetyl-CoA epoxidase subunit PaaE
MSVKFISLPVAHIQPETENAVTISFEKPTQGFDYQPGQYLTLRVPIAGELLRRAYSLSSSPYTDKLLQVTVKTVPGGKVSNYLRYQLKVDDPVELLPPMGNFIAAVDPARSYHYILVAAGSGITPILSILKSVLTIEPKSHVTLLYGNRNQSQIIFKQTLEQWRQQYPDRLSVIHVLSQPENGWTGETGRIEGKIAQRLLSAAIQRLALQQQFYICGPNALMDNVQQLLQMIAVPPKQIHIERFSAPVPDEKPEATDDEEEIEIVTQTVRIKLDGKEYNIVVNPNQSILDAVIARKLDPPYACQEGVCCTCRGKVISGDVIMDLNEALSDEEVAAGYVLTCQSHPLSDDVFIEYA